MHSHVLRTAQNFAKRTGLPVLFLLDLPLCVLEEIVDCVIAPLQHVGTEAKLENFADACHALRALLLTHPLFHKVVTKDIWRKALS